MKKLYFLFFLTIGFFANAQIVNIPDANFKAKLLSASASNTVASRQTPVYNPTYGTWSVSNYSSIDTNGDGEIQVTEARAIKWLKVFNSNISDLTGIESFTELIALDCGYNVLTNLNVSSLPFLQTLSCYSNQLTSLNVSGLANLQFLSCYNNQITTLNVLNLTNLRTLSCYSNLLTNLNVSGLSNLQSLLCYSNQLSSLNVSSLANLQELRCYSNLITNLNVSGLTNLKYLFCYSNQLTNLNVSSLTSLLDLRCNTNQLSSLDVVALTNLQYLDCYSNQLTSLNVSSLANLQELRCYYNPLSMLNVYGLTNLQKLHCNNTHLSSLNVSGLTNLYSMDCSNAYLSSLNVSGLMNLQVLFCDNNQLTNLNIKNNNLSWNSLSFNYNSNLQYICADEEDLAVVQSKINSYGYASSCQVNSYCSFTPNGVFYQISGNTKFDSNNNGCDVSDSNYPNLKYYFITGTNSATLISNQTGNYDISVDAGNYTITPNLENPSYFNISPASFTVNFPTQTSPFTQNFCVTANGVKSDVEVILLQTTPARPGFDATYKLVYRNKGNQVENGIVSLTFDNARLDYVAANPVYNSSAMNSFTWNYTNLQPFETREIEIVFNVNSPMEIPSVNIGNVLNYTTTITTASTDETPTDNTFTLDQTVVGSYDPNDKTCLQGTTITPTEVGKYVHYVIRFENTGTFPAENIVVKDMIDLAKFDITTLVPLKSSHDFFTRINGNKVEFIFENINLDFNDATNDGYVVFKIKTKPTLVVGNTFTNNANIYFDYNFPITTNTYTTTVAALSTQDFDFGSYFTLYPNPAKDVLNIQTKQDLQVNSVEIYNQLGQIIMAVTNSVNSVDVSNLSSGTYFVKINSVKGSANAKFVKE